MKNASPTDPGSALSTPTPSIAQTVCLLALSRGEQPNIPPIARRVMLQRRWIAPPRPFAITEAGRRALATSPHIAEAQRKLDGPQKLPVSITDRHGAGSKQTNTKRVTGR